MLMLTLSAATSMPRRVAGISRSAATRMGEQDGDHAHPRLLKR
jgi:hypothetical protein